MVLIVVFEEGHKILRRKNKIGLNAKRMHGVERNRALSGIGVPPTVQGSAAVRNLPLVVPDETELEQPADVFFQRKHLPKSPLDR